MDARTSRYHDVYAHWQRSPEVFWAEAAAGIDWYEKPKKIFDKDAGIYGRWFAGATCNTCYNALDRHVARGRNDQLGADLRFPRHQHGEDLHLRPHAVRGAAARRHAARLRRREGRPRHHLHADGAGGGVRDACLRAHRRHPFGGVRRLRRQGARHPHRRRQAEGHPLRQLRHRGRARRPLQAAARRGDQSREAQAAGLHDPAAPAMRGAADAGPRPRLAQGVGERGQLRQDQRVRAGRRHRPALHSLHVGHDGNPERRGARQWRPHGRAQMVDAESLRRLSGRGVVVGLRHRLGGRPLLHRLCAAVPRLHLDPLRGQAGRHARRRRLLARDRAARRGGAVHRAHRLPRHQEGRPEGRVHQEIRPVEIPHAVPRRRARRPADHPVGGGNAQRAGDRSLVADRNRLVHRRQSGRPRARCRCATARPACRCRAMPSTSSTRPTRCSRPTRSARSWSSCRCRRPASRRCGSRTSASRKATSRSFPATTRRPTPATRTTTATSM